MFNPFSTKAEKDIIIPAIIANKVDEPIVLEARKRLVTKKAVQVVIMIAGLSALHAFANHVEAKYPAED